MKQDRVFVCLLYLPAVIFNSTNLSVFVHSNDYNRAYDSQNDVSSASGHLQISAYFHERVTMFATKDIMCMASVFIHVLSRENILVLKMRFIRELRHVTCAS